LSKINFSELTFRNRCSYNLEQAISGTPGRRRVGTVAAASPRRTRRASRRRNARGAERHRGWLHAGHGALGARSCGRDQPPLAERIAKASACELAARPPRAALGADELVRAAAERVRARERRHELAEMVVRALGAPSLAVAAPQTSWRDARGVERARADASQRARHRAALEPRRDGARSPSSRPA
jgi:hypothetical protein